MSFRFKIKKSLKNTIEVKNMDQNMKQNNATQKKEKFPFFSVIFLGLAIVSFIILVIAKKNISFADSFNKTFAASIRKALAVVTSPIPFSLAEFFVMLLPLILVLLIMYAIKFKSKNWKSVLSYTLSLLAAASTIFSIFALGFGVGYYVPTLDKQLEIESVPVSAEELRDTALWLTEEINDLIPDIYFSSSGASVMPYSLDDMSQKLMVAYESLNEDYPFLQSFNSRIKPALISVVMSHAHTTGVYSFFTGEANYTLPFTAAHEFAHQRGVARENEANFIAFLVCAQSEDPYIRYSGYLNLYEYVVNALYSASKTMYKEVRTYMSVRANGEMKAYSEFYDQYRDSEISKVSSTINNAYLQANGEEQGTKSYGMVVDLAVAYHKSLH